MTAAGLDYVSDGRFILGLGASGPQVIEGFHGVPYDAPIARTREVVDICRQVWRRETLQHQGKYYTIPLPADQGTGLGKPLKLINKPVPGTYSDTHCGRLGPKNVELAAEIAEGWQPIFYLPEKAQDVWGEALAAGQAERDPGLGELDVLRRPGIGHRRKRRAATGIRQTTPGALHRRHGRQGQELLSHAGHPVRLRRAGRPHPRALPGRRQGRRRQGWCPTNSCETSR